MSTMFSGFEDLHDDEEIAFTQLAERFEAELDEKIQRMESDGETAYFHVTYVNRLLAAAKALDIRSFDQFRTPSYDEAYEASRAISFAVESFKIQVAIRSARVGKVYSVALDAGAKARIHALTKKIRETIGASDLEESKRNSLFSKLSAFEADVDRSRTKFDNAMLAMMDVAHVAKEFAGALNPLTGFVNSITELLGGAKAKEPERVQLPSPEPQKRISPPPKQITKEEGGSSRDLDDEIPF